MKNYEQVRKGLGQLLNIAGASGETERVQSYVIKRLEKIEGIDIVQWGGGNIVAKLANGDGIKLGINAHMDTVHEFRPDRKVQSDIIEGTEYLSTNDNCLGADDRAGLEIVLSLMEDFGDKNSKMREDFDGTLVAWITIDEEIGCIGASQLGQLGFFENLDMSITFDRRNTRDIVCKNFSGDFCDVTYAKAFVQASNELGMDWTPVSGSISDAMISSDYGVNSVNLSVGYDSEHTTYETLNVNALYETYMLAHKFIELLPEFDIKPLEKMDDYSYAYPYGNGGSEYFSDGGELYSFDDNYKTGQDTTAQIEANYDGVEISQKYYGVDKREYVEYVTATHNQFIDMMAEYLSQYPSAYDELQRKITTKAYGYENY